MVAGEVLHAVGSVASEVARSAAGLLGCRVVTVPSAHELDLVDVEVLVGVALERDDWSRAARLRLVQLAGSGADRFLPAPGLSPSVPIANARGVAAPEMAEFAVASLLALAKRLPEAWENQAAARWRRTEPRLLSGGRAVVVGTGPVGRGVATRLRALGMAVTGVRRSGLPCADFDEVAGPADLGELLPAATAVVVAVASTTDTKGMFDAELLGRCGPGCLLVNVARGDVLDEIALAALLRAGHLGGAAIDVVAHEPLAPDSPLWTTPGLLVTPHVSWYSPDYVHRVGALLAENVRLVARGARVRNPVDPGLGY